MDLTSFRMSPERAQLLVRLLAERANLLTQLVSIDELTLSTADVVPGWTPAMLLAHAGYWDAYYTDRFAKLLDDRRQEIQSITIDEVHQRNAAYRIRIERLSFSEALAICQKERRGFLATLSRASDEFLYRRQSLRAHWRVAPISWVRRRYRHDAGHAADLSRWRQAASSGDSPLRYVQRALLRPLLSLSRNEFLVLAALIPAAERETRPIRNYRSLKQMVCQQVAHDEFGVIALDNLRRGRAAEPVHSGAQSVAHDDEPAESRCDQLSWTDVWDRYANGRRALLRLADLLPDEAMSRELQIPWLKTSTIGGYLFGMFRREQTMADALRDTLELSPLPRRLGRKTA